MTQRDNILQELRELRSSLANTDYQNVYQVPVGYFDELVNQVLARIKALDALDAAEELNYISPLLNSISREMPYSVPADFFDGLTENVIQSLKHNSQTPAEELEILSPLLSGLKKEMPYSVPKGYFERLNGEKGHETMKPAARVISMTRQRWFRYAAAAVVIGFVALTGFLIFNKPNQIDPKKESFAWVEKNMKKVSTDDLDSFVELTEASAPVVASADVKTENEIQNLIRDIPDEDIQKFLDETQPADEPGSNDDLLMN